MKSQYLSAPQTMKPSLAPETPYQRAKQEWDSRIGSSVVQAKNWRIAFFTSALFSLSVSLVAIFQAHQAKVVPVLVGIDKESGEPTVIGAATEKQAQIGGLEIKYFLTQFIRFVRSVPLDQVLIKQNWIRAYSFLRKDAAELLNEMTNKDENSALKKIGKVVVSIQPISVVLIPETNSYQVRWKETAYSSSGNKTDEYTMIGTFVLEFDPPKDQQTLAENPLGIFIKNFQWTREL